MKAGQVFLQHGFWKAIQRDGSSIFGPHCWDLLCVLRSSILRAEIPIELFGQDDMLSILWHESGGSCYVEDGEIDDILKKRFFSAEYLNSVFLLDKDNVTCEKYEQKSGQLCLNSEMLIENSYLITGKKIPIDFHEELNYYDLKKYFYHSCNSLLLIDPYILKENRSIKYHIKPLLDNILPYSLDIPFHISIFSGIGKINDAKLGESYHDDILKMLQEIRPNLFFSLTLYQIPIQGEGWHARYIITNNLIIHATEGFDFFGPVQKEIRAKKAGKFEVSCPWLEKNNNLKEYYIWINKTEKESVKGYGYHHERWGTKENRLFKLTQK